MLEQEIKQNQKTCPRCQMWQSGGDMDRYKKLGISKLCNIAKVTKKQFSL